MFDGLRLSADGGLGPEQAAPERKVAEVPEAALRRARTRMLVRHAGAVDAIFEMQERGGKASPEQVEELQEARKDFEDVRPMARTMPKPPTRRTRNLPRRRQQAGSTAPSAPYSSKPNCAPIRSAAPTASWNAGGNSAKPANASYQAGDMSSYRRRGRRWATWRRVSNAIRSLNPSSKNASETSASGSTRAADSLAFNHGIDLGRGRGIGL
jgi:hypothetical protein